MSELLISDRVVFASVAEQIKFICSVKSRLNETWISIARTLDIHPRTLRDWLGGKTKMSYRAAKTLSKLSKISLPKNIKILKWKNHLRCAGRLGGIRVMEIYGKGKIGDDRIRRENWRKWWDEKGKFISSPIGKILPVGISPKNSLLAEFVGIMIGDGGIAPYHIAITLHRENEKEYGKFIIKIIQELFNITPRVYPKKNSNAVDIVVQRKKLVQFLLSIGLRVGNKIKAGLDIPDWVKKNNSLCRSCVRGLIDTDGCIFWHSYKVKSRIYKYPKISFSSKSQILLDSVEKILKKCGIHARIAGLEVKIEGQESVQRYMKLIGTHNSKHLLRYKGGVPERLTERFAKP